MKLKSLNISGYKNIDNITIDFSQNDRITLLVGNNGCGKSNILEAISAIFADLFKGKTPKDVKKPDFDYALSYEVNDRNIDISLNKGQYIIKVDSKPLSKNVFANDKFNLPSNIISCYSGECNRLWDNYYWPYYKDYIDNVKTSEKTPRLPLIYINKYTLDIALLTIFYYDFDAYTDLAFFCNDVLGIKAVSKIKFDFNSEKIADWKPNVVLNLVQAICGIDDVKKTPPHEELTIEVFKNRVAPILADNGKELFSGLYGATMPKDDKIITGIRIECELTNGSIITVDDLSEGEKKNLLITTILEILADENSLLLFDEPDSHIHISRKRDLIVTLDKYHDRESILTTHSPTLACSFEVANHIIGLGLDEHYKIKLNNKKAADLIFEITNGIWNIHQQNVFLSSNKPITLLVEGETDKIIIEQAFKRLCGNYPNLDFDVFHCSGASNIPQLLVGLKTSDMDWGNKKIIAIFDSDQEGKDCCNKTQLKYAKTRNERGLYAITLTKEYSTIENLFPDNKFNEAYTDTLRTNPFSGSIKDFADKLLIRAKIKLSVNCKGFNDIDFDGFKPLFDLVNEIAKL